MFVRTRFNRGASKGLVIQGPSMTQMQFRNDADINQLVRRALGGDPSVCNLRRAFAPDVDVTDAPESFHSALNKVAIAESVWNSLPAHVRHSYGSAKRLVEIETQKALDAAKARAASKKVEVPPSTETKTTTPSPSKADE